MILIIAITLFILAVAFYQSVQGSFSAVAMAILTVLCAALAFNYYEPLAGLMVDKQGGYAHGLMLLIVFFVPLLVGRILLDRFLKGNVHLGIWPDRAVGFGLGLFTAFIMAGMLMFVLQMLPMPAAMLTWQPYDEALQVKDSGPPAWAANFTEGLLKHLSAGSLSPLGGDNELAKSHDNLSLECFGVRNRPNGAEIRVQANSLEVEKAYLIDESKPMPDDARRIFNKVPYTSQLDRHDLPESEQLSVDQQKVSGKTKVLVIRCWVSQDARDSGDDWFRLPASQFRLVCASGQSYYPVGYLTYAGLWRLETSEGDKPAQVCQISVDRPVSESKKLGGGASGRAAASQPTTAGTAKALAKADMLAVDWVYRIPAVQTPALMVFRRSAQAEVPPAVVNDLPPVKSTRGVQLALGTKPVGQKASFTPDAKAGPFEAVGMTMGESLAMPAHMIIALPSAQQPYPAVYRDLAYEGYNVKKVMISAGVVELSKFAEGKPAVQLTGLYHPSGTFLFQAEFKGAGQAVAPEVARSFKPQLLLDDGRRVGYKGFYIKYKNSQKADMVAMDFDEARKTDNTDGLSEDMIRTLTVDGKEIERVMVFFTLPEDREHAVTGITFGAPGYEFFLTSSLAMIPNPPK